MKDYPLDVHVLSELASADQGHGYYSKGHHDPQQFRAKVAYEYDEQIPAEALIRHVYYRCSMWGGNDYEGWLSLEEYNQTGRGRFPVTVWERP
jgi:hypothetical protein